MTDDDQGWIEQSRQGDPEAFASLVRRYQRMIYALAYRMSGSAADAEDLTQETFIHAHAHLAAFRAEARFSSWLCRIAVNQCLNWRTRTARREELQHAWNTQRAEAPTADSARTQKVQAALLKLPPKQRAAIVLTVYEEMNHAEAAHALGCTEATVSWRLFAARTKLKRWLKAEVPHE